MHVWALVVLVLLVGWTIIGAYRYPRMKEKLRNGDRHALLRMYRTTIAGQIVMAGCAVIGIQSRLFTTPALAGGSYGGYAAWGALGLGAVLVLAIVLARFRHRDRDPEVLIVGDIRDLIPRTQEERLWFLGVALCAGVCEEILFRGFGFYGLHLLGLPYGVIWLVDGLLFGCAHLYQGLRGMVGTAVMGIVFALIYSLTGILIFGMMLHFALDARLTLIPTSWLGLKERQENDTL
ncbi:MAG: CPBP family intramembrane glutamic endopeptidase [Candidatus Dormibacteria bacterium]